MSFTFRLLAMTLLVAGCASEKRPVASDPVVCSLITTSTSARTDRWNTDSGIPYNPITGAVDRTTWCEGTLADAGSNGSNGGSGSLINCACPFAKGSNVLVQCSSGTAGYDIYLDSTRVTASSVDQFVNFTTLTDPYPVYLSPNEAQISVIAADGGTGVCKFMTTLRKRPW